MNALIKVRKIVSHVENIFHEGGQPRKEAIKKGAIKSVVSKRIEKFSKNKSFPKNPRGGGGHLALQV